MAKKQRPKTSYFPLEVGDVIRTNYCPDSRAHHYRVTEIQECQSCGQETAWVYPHLVETTAHIHLTMEGYSPDGAALKSYEKGPFYLNGYRYIGNRCLGRKQFPGTCGYSKNHEASGGYDEIFIIQKRNPFIVRQEMPQTSFVLE